MKRKYNKQNQDYNKSIKKVLNDNQKLTDTIILSSISDKKDNNSEQTTEDEQEIVLRTKYVIRKKLVVKLEKNAQNMAKLILKALNEDNIFHAKTLWDFFFKTNQLNEWLLSYLDYAPIDYAIEKKRFDILAHFLTNNTPRGSLLVLCYKDYSVIKTFINTCLTAIKEGRYKSKIAQDIFEIFHSIQAFNLYDVIEGLIYSKKTMTSQGAIEMLHEDFKVAQTNLKTPEISEEEVEDKKLQESTVMVHNSKYEQEAEDKENTIPDQIQNNSLRYVKDEFKDAKPKLIYTLSTDTIQLYNSNNHLSINNTNLQRIDYTCSGEERDTDE